MRLSATLLTAILTVAAAALGGCSAAVQAIAINEYYNQREGSHTVDAEYRGLPGKSFVVLVSAPTSLQADQPALTARTAALVAGNLAGNAKASGFVPAERSVQYQYNRPNWVARPMGEVAKELGVDRVIHIDISEYRLREPGNQYSWEGVANAQVAVYEADSAIPDDPAYQKLVRVRFPDEKALSPSELPESAVNSELSRRLSERTAWLFYTHDEKNILKY